MQLHRKRAASTALVLVALGALYLSAGAAAKLTGPYTVFEQCPYTNPEVKRCIYSTTEGGEVVLGSKTVPIVNQVTLQAGLGKKVEGFAPFFAPKNGITLSKTAQPVPGGLAGLVNCKKISEPLLRISCEAALESKFTGVNSTLEIAGEVSKVELNELHLAEEAGVALKLPVKIHLENPFLGSSCYVGSDSSPIIWELTAGETNPPSPNKPIKGSGGTAEIIDEGQIAVLKETELVDNAWEAPGATGCGGFLVELILDPIINVASGLPAEAGHNTAILKTTATISTTIAINANDEANP